MIPVYQSKVEPISWQHALQRVVTNANELFSLLDLPESHLKKCWLTPDFPLKVPREYIARMQKGNLDDPLLLQVLAQKLEQNTQPGFTDDPVGEQVKNSQPGLIQKYPGRVLWLLSTHCAINCRYCFRRAFPYAENRLSRTDWQQLIEKIQRDKSIYEVILSGGDPLTVGDNYLAEIIKQLNNVTHLKSIRLHTRLPVVIPQRITADLCSIFTQSKIAIVMVLHINHAQEIDESLTQACQQLHNAGVRLLNQSVLLHKVNDSASTLRDLSFKLFDTGITPYYLHLLDPVSGSAHFDVPFLQAQTIYHELTTRLPGYLLPKLVREVPGELSKTIMV